jgi:DNA-binding beta-propeller fold protein YncE
VEVVSPLGQANVPGDFGERSLWATGFAPSGGCDDVKMAGEACCGGPAPPKALLKRVDPQTDEVVAKIDVDRGAVDIAVDESSGAVWVAGVTMDYDKPEDNKLSRVDPATNRVVEEIPIRAGVRICKYHDAGCLGGGAYTVAVGEGAVWVSSDDKLLKENPEANEVAGMVSVGVYYSPLVVYGGGVWAMGQGANEYWLVRVDPRTMHVVAAEDIGAFWITPGLAAGGGYVWFESGKGLARVSP